MITAYRRAANEVDIRAIKLGKGSLGKNLATVVLPIALVAFGVAYLASRSLMTSSVIAAGLFLASLVSNLRFFLGVKRRRDLKRDDDAVEVFEVSASSVLDLEPPGDIAPAFCFFVGDGKALLLVGQWLLSYDSFPAEEFRLHCWADTKEPIRIDLTKRPIRAELSKVQLRPNHRVGKVELLTASRETLQDDLDRSFTRTSTYSLLRR